MCAAKVSKICHCTAIENVRSFDIQALVPGHFELLSEPFWWVNRRGLFKAAGIPERLPTGRRVLSSDSKLVPTIGTFHDEVIASGLTCREDMRFHQYLARSLQVIGELPTVSKRKSLAALGALRR